jgi:hypothetical protein
MSGSPDSQSELEDLRRQRALVAAHLAWLDGRIEAASGPRAPAPAAGSPVPAATVDAVAHAAAEEAFERLQESERTDTAALKRGCLVTFVAAFLLLAGGVFGAWWFFYSGR